MPRLTIRPSKPAPIDLEHQARMHAMGFERWMTPAEAIAEARRWVARGDCWWHTETVAVERDGQLRMF